ncbi:MAG TPA: potassium/proton antiporter [Xanthomonadales bacterium]|nr:potassium/proton antiporter [Xanthomonadales bacterium]
MELLQLSNIHLLTAAILVLAGIASSLVARRFGAPLLLVFLVLGMLFGREGPVGLVVDDYRLAYLLGSLALAVILFDGGLRTRIQDVRTAVAPAAVLATLGVVLTAALTALAGYWLLDLDTVHALLLGAIIASTDAAAVFFLLHAGGLHLRRRVAATLEVESGSNDPVAVLLTLLLVGWIAATDLPDPASLAWMVLAQAGFGLAFGALGGLTLAWALNRWALPSGLHPLLALAGAIAVFALSNLAGGSGFLSVYLAGLVLGNRPVRAYANLVAVQDAGTWLAQMVMFLVLGLLVVPSALLATLWPALALAAALMLVIRPAVVALCLIPFGFKQREIAFIGWVGLRGAVGIFLASIPLLVGLPGAETLFNVAFVVVMASLVVQGWTLRAAAYGLRVALPRSDPPIRRVELDLPGQLQSELVGYRVEPGSAVLAGATLPSWARSALRVRDGHILLPPEGGPLQAGDYAYFLAPPGNVVRLDWLFAEPAEARKAEREVFGAFALPGDVPLGELADFYSLPIPARYRQHNAAELFATRFDQQPRIGDRLVLGDAVLIARELHEERVSRVGLKFGGIGLHLFGASAGSRPDPSPLQRLAARWRRPRP